jgi:hypothetical protein
MFRSSLVTLALMTACQPAAAPTWDVELPSSSEVTDTAPPVAPTADTDASPAATAPADDTGVAAPADDSPASSEPATPPTPPAPTGPVASPEVCGDGVDNDLDGAVDEDGVGAIVRYLDADGDGVGALAVVACPDDRATVAFGGDCDDADAGRSPLLPERCDGLDEDCDGLVDDGLAVFTSFADADRDGYGDVLSATSSCALAAGRVLGAGDCDDADALRSPSAAEVCDGDDQDCDGLVDEGVPTAPWFADLDGDGFGEVTDVVQACMQPAGRVAWAGDCDDASGATFPGAAEVCDAGDQDCDGAADEGLPTERWFADIDGDGFGDAASPFDACMQPVGHVRAVGDCDDASGATFPGAPETCDGLDQDCDAELDEGLPTGIWYADRDADGFGDDRDMIITCAVPADRSLERGDCDDASSGAYPGAGEVWYDGVDQSCDGGDDFDQDGDGVRLGEGDCDDASADVFPGAPEVWYDGVDQDCDPSTEWDQDGDGLAAAGAPVAGAEDCDDLRAYVGSLVRMWRDQDGDGFGDPAASAMQCGQPAGWVLTSTDCADRDPARSPMATEVCDGVDQDCDGAVDDAAGAHYWIDADGDGQGELGSVATQSCARPRGHVDNDDDCDDADDTTGWGFAESCDGISNDCDDDTLPDEGEACGYASWTTWGGSIYIRANAPLIMTWDQSREFCEDHGYHMWVPESVAEVDAVRAGLQRWYSASWVGARELNTAVRDSWAWDWQRGMAPVEMSAGECALWDVACLGVPFRSRFDAWDEALYLPGRSTEFAADLTTERHELFCELELNGPAR